MRIIGIVSLIVASLVHLGAASYISDPDVKNGGNGSKESPWPSLEACISSGNLQKLKAGDTLYLLKGYHGAANITGINEDFINIFAAPDQEVTLSRLTMTRVAKWHIKDLRISPTFGGQPYKGNIVSFADQSGESGQVIIEGCEVFAVDDHKTLNVKSWMELNSGILMGRHGKGSIVKNCYIRNTRFALALTAYDGIADGNVIENFSADGIRMTRDGEISQYNIIKNAFVSDGDGDKNHDDAIQCFLFNKGTGTMKNLTINHNILIGHQPGVEPLAAVNQGIGLFDGPLVNFHIEGNVVMVSHYHGVSVFDGQGCTVTKNVTWTNFSGKLRPWVMLGTKLKQSKDNTVTDNYALSFNLKQPGTIESNNKITTKEIYEQALLELSEKNFELYDGPYHRIARRHRITGEYVEVLPELKNKTGSDSASNVGNSKLGAKPLVKPEAMVMKEGQLEVYNLMLQRRLDENLLNAKFKPRFTYSIFKQEVSVEEKSGDSYKLNVPKLGSQMTLNIFSKMKPVDALSLIQAIADKDADQDNALLAFYYLAMNDQVNASFHIRKAGSFADAVNAAYEKTEKSD